MFFPRPSDVGCLLHGGLQILAGPLRVGSPDVAPFGGPAGLDLHDRRPLHWAFDTCVQLALHSKQISGACFDNTLPNKTCLLNGVPPSYEYKLFLQIYLVRRTLVCIHSCAGHTCSLHKTQTHLHASTPSLTPHGLHLPFALAPLQLPQRGRASPPSSMAHRSGSSVAPLTPLRPSKFFGDPRTFAKGGEAKTEFAILRLYRCHVVCLPAGHSEGSDAPVVRYLFWLKWEPMVGVFSLGSMTKYVANRDSREVGNLLLSRCPLD